MCGGSSKIPKLQSRIKSLFENAEILNSINPDEVIAVGAAKQAREKIICLSEIIVYLSRGVLRTWVNWEKMFDPKSVLAKYILDFNRLLGGSSKSA